MSDQATFLAQAVQRNRCAGCGTLRVAHDSQGRCPDLYRPDTMATAIDELAAAERSGDPARIFVARGNVQRLQGRP